MHKGYYSFPFTSILAWPSLDAVFKSFITREDTCLRLICMALSLITILSSAYRPD